jgi:hypothetical protein
MRTNYDHRPSNNKILASLLAAKILKKNPRGFSSLELVVVLALSAVIMTALVVGYGSLVRARPRPAATVRVNLGSTAVGNNFFGVSSSTRDVTVAPSMGALAAAEKMRERFYADVMSGTAVYCLYRTQSVTQNSFRPTKIVYDPEIHRELDTSLAFRDHIVRFASVPGTLFLDIRNPDQSIAPIAANNASIYILSYSGKEKELAVLAVYDIDFINQNIAGNSGVYASVRRYAALPAPSTSTTLSLSLFYDLYYENQDATLDFFSPVFVSFERSVRRAHLEVEKLQRFKMAAEKPFYLVWWPDPAARSLQPNLVTGPTGSTATANPLITYNHQGGRTSFMFTIPAFPAL